MATFYRNPIEYAIVAIMNGPGTVLSLSKKRKIEVPYSKSSCPNSSFGTYYFVTYTPWRTYIGEGHFPLLSGQ